MYHEFNMCKVIYTSLDPIYVFYKTFLVNVFSLGFFVCLFLLITPFFFVIMLLYLSFRDVMLKNVAAQVPKLCATVPSSAAALTREAVDTSHFQRKHSAPCGTTHGPPSVCVCSSSGTDLMACEYLPGYWEQLLKIGADSVFLWPKRAMKNTRETLRSLSNSVFELE